jgi:hypothetical protein
MSLSPMATPVSRRVHRVGHVGGEKGRKDVRGRKSRTVFAKRVLTPFLFAIGGRANNLVWYENRGPLAAP